MRRWELNMRRDGQGSRMVRRDGQEGRERGQVTDSSSVRLLGLFADRLLCHRQPHALALRVLGTWIG